LVSVGSLQSITRSPTDAAIKEKDPASALPAAGRKLDLGEQLGQMLLEQSIDL